MNILKLREYKFYDKFKENVDILILSDIHFSKYVLKRTYNLFKKMSNIKCDYLLIPGDLIDYYDVVKDEYVKLKIIESLTSFSKKGIKVLIILGNHEYYLDKSKKVYLKDVYNKSFFKELNKINNVFILNNEDYEDDKIKIFGISLPIVYYKNSNNIENKNCLINILNKYNSDLKTNKVKILMIHSPLYMNDIDILEYTKNFYNVICGHFHNGAVPMIIDDIWKSNKGIIGPYYKKFPKNSRGLINNKIIVSGAVNTVQPKNLFFKNLNFYFPIHICKISYIKSSIKKIIKSEKYKKNL